MPIFDALLAYNCSCTGEKLILVARNALCVLGMEHNLLPPFLLHEAGLVVNEMPKIHIDDPSVEYH